MVARDNRAVGAEHDVVADVDLGPGGPDEGAGPKRDVVPHVDVLDALEVAALAHVEGASARSKGLACKGLDNQTTRDAGNSPPVVPDGACKRHRHTSS